MHPLRLLKAPLSSPFPLASPWFAQKRRAGAAAAAAQRQVDEAVASRVALRARLEAHETQVRGRICPAGPAASFDTQARGYPSKHTPPSKGTPLARLDGRCPLTSRHADRPQFDVKRLPTQAAAERDDARRRLEDTSAQLRVAQEAADAGRAAAAALATASAEGAAVGDERAAEQVRVFVLARLDTHAFRHPGAPTPHIALCPWAGGVGSGAHGNHVAGGGPASGAAPGWPAWKPLLLPTSRHTDHLCPLPGTKKQKNKKTGAR